MIIGNYKLVREDKHNIVLSKKEIIKGKKGDRSEYKFLGYYRTIKSAVERILKDEELSLIDNITLNEFITKLDTIHAQTHKNLTQALKGHDIKILAKE